MDENHGGNRPALLFGKALHHPPVPLHLVVVDVIILVDPPCRHIIVGIDQKEGLHQVAVSGPDFNHLVAPAIDIRLHVRVQQIP